MAIQQLNPATLHRNPAFSQGMVIPAGSSIVIVGGQNGVGSDGQVVSDSIGPQTEQAMRNLLAVLQEAGAKPADVAKLTIYLVHGVDLNEAYCRLAGRLGRSPRSRQRRCSSRPSAVPGALVEIEAIAAIPG